MRIPTALLLATVFAFPQVVSAQPPPATHETAVLTYERRGAAESCPDREEIEERVAAQLGYQPFVADGRLEAEVVLSGDARGLRASISMSDATGKRGHRELSSPARDCRELASAVSLALSIAIDPVSAGKQHPEPEPAPPEPKPIAPPPPTAAPPAPAPVPAPAPAPAEKAGPPLFPRLGAGAHGSFGTAPATALGVFLFAGVERGSLSLDLEARADLPASRQIEPRGTVKSSLLLLTLLPCFQGHPWFACASISGGALQGSGEDVAEPQKKSTFYSAAGGRIGAELALARPTALAVFAGGAATITRTTLSLNDRDAWTTPTLTGLVGIELIFRLR